MSNLVSNLCRRLQFTPAQKSVLMCLADRADDAGVAWPSIPGICEWTCLSRTAAIQAIKWLESSKYVKVEREVGRNNRVTINLAMVEAEDQCATRTGTADVPVRQTHPHQCATRTTPVRQTHPTRAADAPDTSEDINKTSKKTRASKPRDLMSEFQELLQGVDVQVLNDWQALRKQKRAPITETVLRDIGRQAGSAGMTMNDALTMACARGWQGFRADWVTGKAPGRGPSRHTGFDRIDYTAGIGPNGEVL